jgi:hypothetical protein
MRRKQGSEKIAKDLVGGLEINPSQPPVLLIRKENNPLLPSRLVTTPQATENSPGLAAQLFRAGRFLLKRK